MLILMKWMIFKVNNYLWSRYNYSDSVSALFSTITNFDILIGIMNLSRKYNHVDPNSNIYAHAEKWKGDYDVP